MNRIQTKRVLVVGVFDLFHRGHLELLRKAKGYGDELYVVVNGDQFTSEYKRTPVINEIDRQEIVSSLSIVTSACVSNRAEIRPFIERWNITTVVHGDDWPHSDYLRQVGMTQQEVEQLRLDFVYVPYYGGTSTSSIIRRIKEGNP